MLSAYWSQK
jgi:hypothetical protein